METQLGHYLYGIIQTDKEESFGEIIGDPGGLLRTVRYKDLAVVVSYALVKDYPVTREASLAHQRAIELVMKAGHTVLPVKFSTIAENESEIVTQVLQARYEELKGLLERMHGKQEIGLKCYWKDMPAIFESIAKENQSIRSLKEELERRPQNERYYGQIELGKMVQEALKEKKAAEVKKIFTSLGKYVFDMKENQPYGDEMFLSAAFLVEGVQREKTETGKTSSPVGQKKQRKVSQEESFFRAVSRLQKRAGESVRFKTVVGAPPFNFVTIVIHWKREATTNVSSR